MWYNYNNRAVARYNIIQSFTALERTVILTPRTGFLHVFICHNFPTMMMIMLEMMMMLLMITLLHPQKVQMLKR